jgi:hypothetical protein
VLIQQDACSPAQAVHGKRDRAEVAVPLGRKGIKPSDRGLARRVICPNCAKLMRLAHTDPKFGETPKLNTFACRDCGLYYTEAVKGDGT